MSKKNSYPVFLNEFVNKLQIQLARSLKRSGACTLKGKFTISNQVKKYLIKNFKITKRMHSSNILSKLRLDESILKNIQDSEPSTITNFNIRLENKYTCSYITLGPKNKSLVDNPKFHWEFIREVQMKETDESEINAIYENAVNEQRNK